MKLFGGFELSDNHELQFTDEDIKLITNVLDELGFRYKYIPPSQKNDSFKDIEFVDIYYKTPRMFVDEKGMKFLIPNYNRNMPDKLPTKYANLCMTLNLARENQEEEFRPHLSIDMRLLGACWPYGRKEPIVVNRPAGMVSIYNYGTVKDHIETFRSNMTILKNCLDNGEEFPKKKK